MLLSAASAAALEADRDGTLALESATSTGRRGSYYLPREYKSRALPLLVMLHGTGGKGSAVIVRLSPLAERERFIAVAPDSASIAGAWTIQRRADGVSEDYRHIMACAREVLAVPGLRVDSTNVLIAGFSVGGGAAAYIASHETIFTAFAVLHGHVPLEVLGSRRVRGWLSTGSQDRSRTPEYLRNVAERMMRREGFFELEMRVFRSDHSLGDEELAAMVAWWLHTRPNQR